jgi:AraC-like DNA-binding protein
VGRNSGGCNLLIDLRGHLEQRPDCSACEGARRFGLSRRTFQRRLRELGTSFQQEINAARLRVAKRLMQETDNPLKWIAVESGYASLQHFSSTFRARVGLSPSAWRAGASDPALAPSLTDTTSREQPWS